MNRTRRLRPRLGRDRRPLSSSTAAGSCPPGRSWAFRRRRDRPTPDPSSSSPNSRGGAVAPDVPRRPRLSSRARSGARSSGSRTGSTRPPSASRPEPGPRCRGSARRSGAGERSASAPWPAPLRPEPAAVGSSPGAQGARGAAGSPAVREPGSVPGRDGRVAVPGPARISAGCSGQGLGPNLGSARGPNLPSRSGPEPDQLPVSRPNRGSDRAPAPASRPGSAWRARRVRLAGSPRAGGAESGVDGAAPPAGARRRPGPGSVDRPAPRPESTPGPKSV